MHQEAGRANQRYANPTCRCRRFVEICPWALDVGSSVPSQCMWLLPQKHTFDLSLARYSLRSEWLSVLIDLTHRQVLCSFVASRSRSRLMAHMITDSDLV